MDYQLLELLRQRDLRYTTARQVVFKLFKTEAAMTIQEIIVKTAGSLDKASLYRTLNLYRDMGIIQDVVIGGKRKIELTDSYSAHHHHIACSVCGRTVSIRDDAFEKQIESLALSHGFSHQKHSFEITGMCSSCSDSTTRL
jgi:Fe2+ or Zn2+ uptake regulation protein